MLRSSKVMVLTAILLTVFAAWAMAAGSVDQRAVLSGQVLAQGLVKPGTMVHEGDVLVRVESVTGSAPAVRATVDGRVKDVLVSPGDTISTGDVVVRITPGHK